MNNENESNYKDETTPDSGNPLANFARGVFAGAGLGGINDYVDAHNRAGQNRADNDELRRQQASAKPDDSSYEDNEEELDQQAETQQQSAETTQADSVNEGMTGAETTATEQETKNKNPFGGN